jgi:hypothetical protein
MIPNTPKEVTMPTIIVVIHIVRFMLRFSASYLLEIGLERITFCIMNMTTAT